MVKESHLEWLVRASQSKRREMKGALWVVNFDFFGSKAQTQWESSCKRKGGRLNFEYCFLTFLFRTGKWLGWTGLSLTRMSMGQQIDQIKYLYIF